MNNKKIWDIGGDKYDSFVLKILKPIGRENERIMTPHTMLLEKLAKLDKTDSEFIRECLIELSRNFYN